MLEIKPLSFTLFAFQARNMAIEKNSTHCVPTFELLYKELGEFVGSGGGGVFPYVMYAFVRVPTTFYQSLTPPPRCIRSHVKHTTDGTQFLISQLSFKAYILRFNGV